MHRALVEAAEAEGLSLTRYLHKELHHIAGRAEAVRSNAEVIRRTRAQIRTRVDRDEILAVLDEGRDA